MLPQVLIALAVVRVDSGHHRAARTMGTDDLRTMIQCDLIACGWSSSSAAQPLLLPALSPASSGQEQCTAVSTSAR